MQITSPPFQTRILPKRVEAEEAESCTCFLLVLSVVLKPTCLMPRVHKQNNVMNLLTRKISIRTTSRNGISVSLPAVYVVATITRT